jgi:hypothetical protein
MAAPDCTFSIMVTSKHGQNPDIKTSSSKVFVCEKEYINAGEFLNQIEQLITDVLAYRSENSEWPTVEIKHPTNEDS